MEELKELRKGFGDWVLDKNVLFTERKKALMNRDPLVKDFMQKLTSYDPKKDEPPEEQMEQLRQQIKQKWNVGIIVTWAAQPYIYGGFEVKKESPELPLSPVRTNLPPQGEVRIEPLLIFNRTKGYPVSSLPKYPFPFKFLFPINSSDNMITIQVDLDLIDQNDADLVKKAVWEIVKKHLPARKEEKEIPREPRELNFLYDCHQKTFDNYVMWYDLHTQEKLGFRAIAAWDKTQKTSPKRAEQVLEWLMQHKAKCHGHIPGEDKIEKGIKKIYKAIYRTEYSRKALEPIIEEYNCPHHGKSCSSSCPYYQKWIDRFNRLNPIQ